ncbi:PAS domain S-box protein [Chryseolinea lacunae]|uniref:PAS domain S-box protein n=1 Tax=Chryseolinea lacunae TaxID=2801331 RepID=A0ABS1KPL8_9BACT|nr:PAS domain S-box protein [Chryseolinea lacunae]MBL0741404.1 PAS domain S-box protein [Chryseolinea lacunae]
MKTHIKKTLPPILLSVIVLCLLATESLGNFNSPWLMSSSAIVVVSMVALCLHQKIKNEKQLLQAFQTVEDLVSSFLFNRGKNRTETALEDLESELKKATRFIKDIGEGKFDTDYAGMTLELNELNQNNLSGELLHMKRQMQHVAEEERQRTWVATGLARFSEIVRQQNKLIDDVLNQFISELVKYMGANQGGIFIVDDEDPKNIVLELRGCYAYGRRKFIERTITPGEGLVGQAYIEGDTIYLTDVPKNYVSITSGLGEATPRCVILVPLKNHDTIEGIIEVATFEVWKKHEMDFLSRVGEILGSAISGIKVNEVTKKLLADSREQAEQLRAQEEELRQNLEEINATQEAVERKSREAMIHNTKLNAILESAVDTIITLNEDGQIDSINRAGIELFGYAENEIIGKNINAIVKQSQQDIHDQFRVNNFEIAITNCIGQTCKMVAVRKSGSSLPIELAVNVANIGGKKIFTGILRDISERIKAENNQLQYIEELRAQEEELKQNMEELQATQEEIQRQMLETAKLNRELDARVAALNTSTIMSESDLYGNILYVNDKFCEVSQYSREELIGKPHKVVRHEHMPKEVFKLMWETIKAGKVFRGIVKNRKKDGSHYWVDAIISPVLDDERKPIKYIGVRYVIENDVLGEKLFYDQLLALGLLDKNIKSHELQLAHV